MKIPQPNLDAALVSAAKNSQFDHDGGYHLIILSHPRTWERQMLITTFVPDWSKDICFYTAWDSIDTDFIKMHVLWKMTADPNYILHFKAKCNVNAETYEQLNIHSWRFI
mgnify:CR=1 FL=1